MGPYPLESKHRNERMISGLALLTLLCAGLMCVELAIAQDEWLKFEGNPVFRRSADGWDNSSIYAASVLREGEIYRMWYSASNGTSSGIGIAVSDDGIRWTKHGDNPVVSTGPDPYDMNLIFAPVVLKETGHYKMWYTGSDEDYRWTVNLATSPDGITWTKHDSNPVLEPGEWYDGERAGDPYVILDNGVYKMWYTCQNRPEGIMYAIAYATSPDGITWTKYSDNPVLDAGAEGYPDDDNVRDPAVAKTGSLYEMWYRGIGPDWTVCHATSFDGINWARDPGNPVLRGEAEAWDSRIWFPRVLVEGDRYLMWYTSAETDDIGLAVLPVGEALLWLVAAVGCVACVGAGNPRVAR